MPVNVWLHLIHFRFFPLMYFIPFWKWSQYMNGFMHKMQWPNLKPEIFVCPFWGLLISLIMLMSSEMFSIFFWVALQIELWCSIFSTLAKLWEHLRHWNAIEGFSGNSTFSWHLLRWTSYFCWFSNTCWHFRHLFLIQPTKCEVKLVVGNFFLHDGHFCKFESELARLVFTLVMEQPWILLQYFKWLE